MDRENGFRGFDVLCGDKRIEVHLIHQWPDNAIKVRTKQGIKAGEWHHVFVTYDGTSKADGVSVYVDGNRIEADVDQNGLTKTMKTERTLLIGSRHPDSRFKGEIDEAQLYDRKLSESEIQTLAGSSAVDELLAIPTRKRSDDQVATLRTHYFESHDGRYKELKGAVDKLIAEETELKKPLTTVMVMGDMEKPRDTFILNRRCL